MTITSWMNPAATATGGTGDVAWSTPENIISSDDAYSQTSVALSGNTTQFLQAYTFDFSGIPDSSNISGIEVRIERHRDVGVGSATILDLVLQLRTGAGPVFEGDNKADTITPWDGADIDTYKVYGSSGDTWGVDLGTALLKDPEFGVGLRAHETVGPIDEASALVDHIQMRIHYTAPSEGPDGGALAAVVTSKW